MAEGGGQLKIASSALKSGAWDVARIVGTVAVKTWMDPLFDKLNGYVWDFVPDLLSLLLSAVVVVILFNLLFLPPRVVFTWSDADRVPLPNGIHGIKKPPEVHRFELKVAWEGSSLLSRSITRIIQAGDPSAEMTLQGRTLEVTHHKSAPSHLVLVRNIARGIAFDLDFSSGGLPADWSDCVVSIVDAPGTATVPIDYRVVVPGGGFRNQVARLVVMSPNLTTFQVNRVS
jgi:hypothetical protein